MRVCLGCDANSPDASKCGCGCGSFGIITEGKTFFCTPCKTYRPWVEEEPAEIDLGDGAKAVGGDVLCYVCKDVKTTYLVG